MPRAHQDLDRLRQPNVLAFSASERSYQGYLGCGLLRMELLGDLLTNFLGWLGTIIESLFPWPFVTLLLVFSAARSETLRDFIKEIIPMFRRIKIGFAEFELTDETRKAFTYQTSELNSFISSYRDKITQEVTRLVEVKLIEEAMQNCVEKYIIPTLPSPNLPPNFRCTIHVEDFLLKNRLYQLLDYYPSGVNTAGRVHSIRYGVIGKAYRSGLPQIKGDLLESKNRNDRSESEILKIIALEWGLTIKEARNVMKYPSYCAVPLRHEGRSIGVFYMDSTTARAFGSKDDDPTLIKAIQNAAESTGLAKYVAEILSELRSASAKLEIS